MFRRRTSSSGKIHYRVNINKNMCLGVVDIYIDGKPYQPGFNGSYLDIYRDKKIKTISISEILDLIIIKAFPFYGFYRNWFLYISIHNFTI